MTARSGFIRRMAPRHSVIATLALAAAAFVPGAQAAESPGQPASAATAGVPSARQLAALCANCAIVSRTVLEKRKGKATAVGTAGGAVVGGVVGHQVGDGSGVATGVGAVAGREIEKQAKRYNVWVTTVTTRDGGTRSFEARSDPGWKPGQIVRIENGVLVKGS